MEKIVKWEPDKSLKELEFEAILISLRHHGYNKTNTARSLDISIRGLRSKLKRYKDANKLPETVLDGILKKKNIGFKRLSLSEEFRRMLIEKGYKEFLETKPPFSLLRRVVRIHKELTKVRKELDEKTLKLNIARTAITEGRKYAPTEYVHGFFRRIQLRIGD